MDGQKSMDGRPSTDESPWTNILGWRKSMTKVQRTSLDERKFNKCPWMDENWQCDVGGHGATKRPWTLWQWPMATRCYKALGAASSQRCKLLAFQACYKHCKLLALQAPSAVSSRRCKLVHCCLWGCNLRHYKLTTLPLAGLQARGTTTCGDAKTRSGAASSHRYNSWRRCSTTMASSATLRLPKLKFLFFFRW
jgi:hypothetical protein